MYTYSSTPLKDAGRLTADTTDKAIQVQGGFSYISIFNEGDTELRVSIDGDSTGVSRIIYIGSKQGFSDYIKGKTVHYSVASGSTIFKYTIR